MVATQVSISSHKKDTEDIKSNNALSIGGEPPVDRFKFIYWMVFYWGKKIKWQ